MCVLVDVISSVLPFREYTFRTAEYVGGALEHGLWVGRWGIACAAFGGNNGFWCGVGCGSHRPSGWG